MGLTEILVLVFGVLMLGAVVYCAFKGKSFFKYSEVITPILKAIGNAFSAFTTVAPNSSVLKTICLVITSAINAAVEAEKLWKNGALEKEKRNEHAKAYVDQMLIDANITITPPIQTIIDGAIAIICYLLPHETT